MEKLPFDSLRWPLWALLASLAMLGAAHFFERVLHLAPCPLCYNQRQAYWVAAGLAVIALVVRYRGPASRMLFAFNLLIGIAFLTGAGVAAYHSLVEWGILPAPETCAVTTDGIGDLSNLAERLSNPIAVPSCAEPLWDIFGITMANLNFLGAIALAAATFYASFNSNRENTATDTANELPAE